MSDKMKPIITGLEFHPGEIALIDFGTGTFEDCTVLEWSKSYGGWWYVRLQNWGYHYTRNIKKKTNEK